MAERVAQAASGGPGPRIGYGVLVCVGVLLAMGVFASAVSARTVHRGAGRQHRAPRQSSPAPTGAQASAYATSELSGLTVAERVRSADDGGSDDAARAP